MSSFNNIFDNKRKFERTISIDLAIQSGYTVDYGNWINRSDNNEFDIPWHLLEITVSIDDTVLYKGPVDINGVVLNHVMPDSEELQQHKITIAVSGFTSAHSFLHNGQEINAQLLISQFKIEHLDLVPLISQEGTKIFEERSGWKSDSHELLRGDHLQILNFSTPIYPWLLSKFSSINHN